MAHDVFISYSSEDKTVADAVCAKLEGQEIRCWIAPRDVPPGKDSYTSGTSHAIEYQKSVQALLIAQGDQYAVYLNGQPVTYYQNDDLLYGTNWIKISTFDEGGKVEFDNLKLWRLDPP